MSKTKRSVYRPIVTQPNDPTIRYIALTQGQVAVVDAEDYDWLNQHNWCAHWNKDTKSFYARRMSITASGKSFLLGMHAAILNLPDGRHPDHIDGDTLNNRRENLRPSTRIQNQQNRGLQSNNRTGVKGVHYDARRNKYIAQLRFAGKIKHLGSFDQLSEAASVRLAEAKALHGEFFHESR